MIIIQNNDLSSDAEATLVPVSLYATHQTCRLYGGGIYSLIPRRLPAFYDARDKINERAW